MHQRPPTPALPLFPQHLLSVLSAAPMYLLTTPRRCATECALPGSGAAYSSLAAWLRGVAQLCPRLWSSTAVAGGGGFCGGGGAAAGSAAACEAECVLVQLWLQVAVGILLPTVVIAIADELARQVGGAWGSGAWGAAAAWA